MEIILIVKNKYQKIFGFDSQENGNKNSSNKNEIQIRSLNEKDTDSQISEHIKLTKEEPNSRLIKSNLKNVFTGIQGLSNGAELISSYTQTIGSALDAFDGCVGNWNSIIEPLVTSIGSYEDVQVSNQELQAAVAKDVETVESVTKTTNVEEENTNAEENNNDISINNSNNFFAQNSVSNEKSKTELETPKVKVIPFGI